MYEIKTRYPFPDAIFNQRLPDAVPWDVPISDLSGLWLLIECEEHGRTDMPLRRMAADVGWKRTLRTIVPKLRCKKCGAKPSSVVLLADPADQGHKHGNPAQRMELLKVRGAPGIS